MKVLEVAALLGAQILEKHFSHDKTLPGNDHYHAMDYKDLQLFRQNFERTLSMIGEMRIEALASEEPARQNARRSLVANRNIPAEDHRQGRPHVEASRWRHQPPSLL